MNRQSPLPSFGIMPCSSSILALNCVADGLEGFFFLLCLERNAVGLEDFSASMTRLLDDLALLCGLLDDLALLCGLLEGLALLGTSLDDLALLGTLLDDLALLGTFLDGTFGFTFAGDSSV